MHELNSRKCYSISHRIYLPEIVKEGLLWGGKAVIADDGMIGNGGCAVFKRCCTNFHILYIRHDSFIQVDQKQYWETVCRNGRVNYRKIVIDFLAPGALWPIANLQRNRIIAVIKHYRQSLQNGFLCWSQDSGNQTPSGKQSTKNRLMTFSLWKWSSSSKKLRFLVYGWKVLYAAGFSIFVADSSKLLVTSARAQKL